MGRERTLEMNDRRMAHPTFEIIVTSYRGDPCPGKFRHYQIKLNSIIPKWETKESQRDPATTVNGDTTHGPDPEAAYAPTDKSPPTSTRAHSVVRP